MKSSVLVIGYGSIGQRHVEILSGMKQISEISILSSQTNLPHKNLSSLKDSLDLNPDYIIIASPTNKHFDHLNFFEKHFTNRKILVEKPLFESILDCNNLVNDVYVGYNLRFHPIIKKIKDLCNDRKIWTINAICCSYLPDWRNNINYRDSSSAKKGSGGGVMLDLSHEMDYIQWIVGPMVVDHAISKKVSSLEISSDDLLCFLGTSKSETIVNLTLNYYTRRPTRYLIIDGEGISIQANLVSNKLSVVIDGKSSEYNWNKLDRNYTYLSQHEAMLNGNYKNLCSIEEGLITMELINSIRKFVN